MALFPKQTRLGAFMCLVLEGFDSAALKSLVPPQPIYYLFLAIIMTSWRDEMRYSQGQAGLEVHQSREYPPHLNHLVVADNREMEDLIPLQELYASINPM